jgi:hypothetical protein
MVIGYPRRDGPLGMGAMCKGVRRYGLVQRETSEAHYGDGDEAKVVET